MKYIFIAILSCFGCTALSQTQFEGKIIYSVSMLDIKAGEITIYFGNNGIRLEMMDAKRPEKKENITIINLDSGKVFTLLPNNKTFREKRLKRKHSILIPEKTEIAGYTTTPIMSNEPTSIKTLGPLISESILYSANNLNYKIRDVYEGNPELVMIKNGKIVLGAEVAFDENDEQWNDSNTVDTLRKQKEIIKIRASKILSESLESTLFVVPANYSKTDYFDYPVSNLDSVAIITDSTIRNTDSMNTPSQKPSMKNKKQLPPKKKSSTNQNAIRRNDE